MRKDMRCFPTCGMHFSGRRLEKCIFYELNDEKGSWKRSETRYKVERNALI